MWPIFDQDLTKALVKRYLNRGKSKVSQVDYPLTNIRLIISGQCYECRIPGDTCPLDTHLLLHFLQSSLQNQKRLC